MKTHIKNGRVIDPRNAIDGVQDLYIGEGKVLGLGQAPAGFVADRTIDATGLIVAPGLVDLAARLREPGFEYKATLQSEMRAAVAGGVTSLACPPDTEPVLDEPGLVEMLKHRARVLNLAHVYPIGALTAKLEGERLTEMAELSDAGCVAFSQADQQILNTEVLWRALQYATTFGFKVWLRPQDPYLGKAGVAHDGVVASRLGLAGIPSFAETIALAGLLQLVSATGARVHLCRLSTAEAVQMVREAKRAGLPVTCDVGAHHLHLSEMDIGFFDSHCNLIPPLRAERDRDALREGLRDGSIDAVCSDHTPVDEDEKQVPFGESAAGATALELLLPLTLKWAQELKLSLTQALMRVTVDPARVLGIDAGHLSVGSEADLCIFDPAGRFKVSAANLKSQGKNTPFIGHELPGVLRYTFVSGHLCHEAK
jgi:dihydroorotase